MTKEQVVLLRTKYLEESTKPNGKKSTLGEYIRFCLDGNIDFVTSKDCIIFDDDNTMLHCICVNDDGRSQSDFPVKIMSCDYGVIQQIETIMSQANFEKFLDSGFLPASKEKVEFMRKYTRNIKNAAIQPMEAEPYYSEDPQIIPQSTSVIKREDGVEHAVRKSSTTPVVKKATTVEEINAILETANENDTILIPKYVTIAQPMTFDKSVNLVSNGALFTAPIVFKGDHNSIKGFHFEYSEDGETDNKGSGRSIIKASGKSLSIRDCTLYATSKAYNALNIACTDSVEVVNLWFSGSDGDGPYIYNAIEFSQKIPCKSITIKDNVFDDTACSNNNISMFTFNDGALVTIEGNRFMHSANALRISNYTNAKNIKIVCKNNNYESTCEGEYAGFALFQGTKQNKDLSNVTLVLNSLKGPDGKYLTKNGTGTDQVWYTYEVEKDPTVIFR